LNDLLIFDCMQEDKTTVLLTEDLVIPSSFLEHAVTISCFLPRDVPSPGEMGLLLINDGQNMEELGLATMLDELIGSNEIEPLVCVAIHTGMDRKAEYGTARCADYMGRGAKAALYTRFIFEELLPFIHTTYAVPSFKSKSFAGFSLGGLSAMDIVWNHPEEFSRAGVFSGSFWWRTRGLEDGYNEATDRIMHMQVKEGGFYPWLKFFFEAGALDETMDRNHNGVIDSIDDTLGLIDDLISKGYDPQKDIQYLELQEGRHDIATWAKAMPVFLKWGWGK
jgi:enterochelin esterase-like enzyme